LSTFVNKKTQSAIHEKRLKLAQGNSTLSFNPLFQPLQLPNYQTSDTILDENNNTTNPEQEKINEIEYQLKLKQEEFHNAYDNQNWEDLVMVIQTLREAVGTKNMYVTPYTIAAMGILPRVLELLREDYRKISRLQSEAAWLIANVLSGDTEITVNLVQDNCVPILIDCLQSTNEDLQENAMWALSNIAIETFYDFRDLILDAGVLKAVGDQFCRTSKKPSYYKTGSWLLYNLMKKKTPDFDKVSGAIMILSQLIVYPDKECQKYVLHSLFNFSELKQDFARFDVLRAMKLFPKIVGFIGNNDPQLALPALKIAGNATHGGGHIILVRILYRKVIKKNK